MSVALSKLMSTLSPVVVGYDFSHSGHAALSRAVSLAARAPSHLLHVICAIDPKAAIPGIPSDGEIDYLYAARVQESLALAVEAELGAQHVDTRVHFYVYARIGRASEEILQLAREVGADLIVVGSHDVRGLERLFVGSTSEKVMRDAGCSVEIARAKQYAEVELVPVEEVEPDHDHPYLPPHRYTYEDHRVSLRPNEWPLY